MTVAPLIAMKSTKCESLEAVGKELDRRAGRSFEVQFGKGERGSYPPTLTLRSRLKCHRSTTAPF